MLSKDQPHVSIIPTLVASLFVLFLGTGVFFYSTEQGQALTTEALRQAELSDHPKKIPNFNFINGANQEVSLDSITKNDSRILIVDFVYTRCQTVCLALGSSFQNLQEMILQHGLQDKIGLVSISFDPKHDDAKALQRYQERLHMDERVWQVLSLKDVKDRQGLLDTFGIMVIPAPLDEFEHNAAFHIVHHQFLYRIIDIDLPEEALNIASAIQQGLNP